MILRICTMLMLLGNLVVLMGMFLIFEDIQMHQDTSEFYTIRMIILFGTTCIGAIGAAFSAVALIKRWV